MIRPLCLVAAALLVVACASAEVARTGAPGSPPTSAIDPRSSDAPEASPVEDFSYDMRVELLNDGQFRRTVTERYTLLTASPHRFYARLEMDFDPDEDDRPILSATVTLPDGTVKTLDPATVAETPAEGPSGDNLTSRRRLVAPLPALVAGAKIERTTVIVKSRPRLSVGRIFSMPLAMPLPVKELRFVLDHPVGQQVVSRALETELTPVREEKDGRVITTWRRSDIPGVRFPDSLPPEERRFPTLMVSSATGWPEVVGAYHAAVAPRLTSKALDQVVRELKPTSRAPRDVAAAAVEWMHHRLRYTGLDFANAGVIPQTPEETLQRGYGDCKDLSAFLVALLDAAGVPSQLVLVHTADWHDAADELAGLNRFDHAIVKVPGTSPLWIDPTMRGMPVGTLGSLSQARMALVVDPQTTGLTRTPVGAASDNHALVRTEIILPSYGLGTVKTVKTLKGIALAYPRFRAQNLSADQVRREVAQSVSSTHSTETFTYRHSDPLSGLTPFEETLEVQGSKQSLAADVDAVATLGFDVVLEVIPDSLEGTPEEETSGEAVSGPVFVGAPRTIELVTRVKVSPLFELLGGPSSQQDEAGSVRWSYSVKPLSDGAEARMTLTFNERVIPADQVQAVRASLQKLFTADNGLEFANRPLRLLEDGKLQDAVRELRALAQKEPKDALVHTLLARAALVSGLPEEAHTLAREARAMGPMQPPVARTVGWLLSVSPDGIEYGKGMARAEALDALGAARRLEPDDTAARKTLIQLLARNEAGVFGGEGADVDGALKLLALPVPEGVDLELGDFHALLLFETGRDQALLESKALPDSETVRSLRFAARVRSQGTKAALTWLDQHARGGQKEQQLAAASFLLFKARAHPEARDLAKQVRDPGFAQFGLLMANAVRRDAIPFDPKNPVAVILEGMAHAMGLSTRVDAKTLNVQKTWMEQLRKELGPTFSALNGAEEAFLDGLGGAMTPKVSELPGVGVLVTLTTAIAGDDQHLLERHGAGFRHHSVAGPGPQKAAAWKALGKGDLQTVRSWLTYWTTTLETRSGTPTPAKLRKLMQGDRKALTLALSLLAPPEKDQRAELAMAIEALSEARKTLDTKDFLSRQLGRLHVALLGTAGRHDEALAANEKAREDGLYDGEHDAPRTRALILRDAKRTELLEREGRALIERPSSRETGYVMLTLAAHQRGEPATYRDLHVQMAEADIRRPASLNNAAWSALFLDRIEDQDVRRAELALGPKGDNRAALDTLAVLLAQRGEVDRAVATLARLRGTSVEPETAPSVRYARARIAEELGFTRAAKALYTAIPPVIGSSDFNDLSPLAQKRLEVLAKPKAVPVSPAR